MRRMIPATLLVLLLTACGGGREDKAVQACEQAVKERMADRAYTLDAADMKAKAKPEGEDMVHIQTTIVFDPGLPREVKQTMDCKARFVGGKDLPDVVSLTFTW